MSLIAILILSIFGINALANPDSAVPSDVVNSRFGPIRGEILTTARYRVRYSSFKGIRYGKPPIGELRFQDVEKPDKWNYVAGATVPGPECLQIAPSNEFIGNEDCLFANVFSPVINLSKTPDKLKAVMVWIHGGNFMYGSGNPNIFGPDYLIENDVVVVTFNYRLGPFGFLALNIEGSVGNAGLVDQRFFLRWVRDNIKNFGGDPKRVTIFGEGSGGACAMYHTISNTRIELFQGVIAMSGSPLNPWAFQRSQHAEILAFQLGAKIGIKTNDKYQLLSALRNASAESITRATPSIQNKVSNFRPVVENHLIPNNRPFLSTCMVHVYQSGKFKRVPHIIGFTESETIRYFYDNVTLDRLNRTVTDYAEAAKLKYAVPSAYDAHKTGDWNQTYVKETTDLLYKSGIKEALRVISAYNYNPVYYYKLTVTPDESIHKSKGINLPGVANGDDLAYLWWNSKMKLGHSKLFELTTDRITRLWTNFAKYGNPTPDGTTDDPLLNVLWPDYGSTHNYLNVNNDLRIVRENYETTTDEMVKATTRLSWSLENCT